MPTKKIYSFNANTSHVFDGQLVNSIEEADIVFIGGAGRVSPELFDQDAIKGAYDYDPVLDVESIKVFNKALRAPNVKLIVGVNYGAILACGIAGGGLIAHVNNHLPPGLKKAVFGNKMFLLPSAHTQMMYPYNLDDSKYEVLIYSDEKSSEYVGVDIPLTKNEDFKEPEYVLFKGFNKPVLAMMPDVSRMRATTRTVRMTNELIDKYI